MLQARASSLLDLHDLHNGIVMILKTYTRIFTTNLESRMAKLNAVHGMEPHLRLNYDPSSLIGIGDVLVIGGSDEALAPIHGSLRP